MNIEVFPNIVDPILKCLIFLNYVLFMTLSIVPTLTKRGKVVFLFERFFNTINFIICLKMYLCNSLCLEIHQIEGT